MIKQNTIFNKFYCSNEKSMYKNLQLNNKAKENNYMVDDYFKLNIRSKKKNK